jgi:predicted ATP-binding protein involved in virulence
MKLLKNSITNFRGISALVIDAQGKNINIYGENGAGKTTVEDSFLWLMFGKDSADRKDYDLKPHDLDGNPITGEQLEPTVIGTLEHEGKTITLKKIYAEQWPKRDGIKVYDGSKVRYFINEL